MNNHNINKLGQPRNRKFLKHTDVSMTESRENENVSRQLITNKERLRWQVKTLSQLRKLGHMIQQFYQYCHL